MLSRPDWAFWMRAFLRSNTQSKRVLRSPMRVMVPLSGSREASTK